MRMFFDTEFLEDGKTIDLISIGIVSDDGREYYAVVDDTDLLLRAYQHEWVAANVIPHLPLNSYGTEFTKRDGTITSYRLYDWSDPAIKKREVIAQEIVEFVGDDPEFWAYYASYDWIVLCQLFGKMIDLPRHWPKYVMDIVWRLKKAQAFSSPDLPGHQVAEHHALADAQRNRDVCFYLDRIGAP